MEFKNWHRKAAVLAAAGAIVLVAFGCCSPSRSALSRRNNPLWDRNVIKLPIPEGELHDVNIDLVDKTISEWEWDRVLSQKELWRLNLNGSDVTDDQLVDVAALLPTLKVLVITRCYRVTTQGLMALDSLELEELFVSESEQLPRSAIDAFRERHPGCRVYVYD